MIVVGVLWRRSLLQTETVQNRASEEQRSRAAEPFLQAFCWHGPEHFGDHRS